MQFPNLDDEDGDFSLTTAARSRLSSLFHSENSSGDVNQALTFQAPRQPKKNDTPQNSAGTFKLLHAGTVHAYKLIDGNYSNQGKLGCAILGMHENASYKFLLYKGKQVQVTSCSIVPNFKFHVQPNNYVSIYDEKNENWSLNFDSETALIEFAKQIALAKANSQGKAQSTLVIQDLTLGEGPSLDTGHLAEVKYTGWLLSNYSFGQVFDSNMKSESAFRLRLGKSKVIKGWSEGLIGAQKSSRRLLIIPPSLAYGADGMAPTVPPNSTLIFDLYVTKVKISRESSHSPVPTKVSENPDKKPEVQPRSSISQEDNIRMRGASISEQLTQSPKKDKAQLISRMAKMGTATLPLQGAIPAQVSSDSENEEEIPAESPPVQASGSRTASPRPISKPNSRNNSVSSAVVQPVQHHQAQCTESIPLQVTQPSSQILYSQAAIPTHQTYLTQASGFPPYQAQIPSPFHVPQFPMQTIPGMMPPTSMADAHLPLLITETRGQNTEVRLSLAKITDKLDTALQKIDDMRGPGRSSAHVAYMDSALLVQNIERIVQENNQLKEDAEIKNSKIQSLNEKICDILQRNQRFFEESNSMLEQKSDSIQAVSSEAHAKLLNLEKEKIKLVSDLSDATSKMSAMEAELKELQNRESQMKQKVLEYERTGNETKESNAENESIVRSLEDKIKYLHSERGILKASIEKLEKQVEELSISNADLLKLSEDSELRVADMKSQLELQSRNTEDSSKKESSTEKQNEIDVLRNRNEQIIRERDNLLLEFEKLKKQLKISETSNQTHEKRLQELQSELEESLGWKKKYEAFYEKMHKMKTRYDDQIIQLTAEVKRLQTSGAVSSDFSGEIKKVMNALYKLLQGKFEPESTYPGTKVLEMTLQTIRVLTFQMLQRQNQPSSNSSEQDNESRKSSISSELGASNPSVTKETAIVDNPPEGNQNGDPSSSQHNGIGEDTGDLNIVGKEAIPVPEVVEIVDNKVESNDSKNESGDSKKLDSEAKMEEKLDDQTSENNSADALNSVENSTTKDTPDLLQDSKEVKQVPRISPDSSQHFPSAADSTVDGSKIWRPQPPLFDDEDEDEEDDDDWLK